MCLLPFCVSAHSLASDVIRASLIKLSSFIKRMTQVSNFLTLTMDSAILLAVGRAECLDGCMDKRRASFRKAFLENVIPPVKQAITRIQKINGVWISIV